MIRSRPLIAIALALVFCFAPMVKAGQIDPEVFTALEEAEIQSGQADSKTVEVFVVLRDEEPLLSGAAEELSRYSRTVSSSGNRVIQQTSLAARAADITTFSHLPLLALKADRQTIEELADHPDVESITTVKEVSATLSEARMVGSAGFVVDILGYRGSGITVAVLDTGIDANHSDFSDGAIVAQRCFVDCPSGSNVAPDVDGHGTHVAGIITSSLGTASRADIAAVKVLGDNGYATSVSVVNGLNWVLANHETYNIRVVNMSLGGGRYDQQFMCDVAWGGEQIAIRNLRKAGVLTVAASGNDGWTDAVAGPACLSEVLSVGSTADATFTRTGSCTDNAVLDKVSCFSNAHNTGDHETSMLDLLAPGCRIESTRAGTASGKVVYCGTSMASPFVAGIAATLFARRPAAMPRNIESLLIDTGTMTEDYRTPGMSYPRVNALIAHLNIDESMRPVNDKVQDRITVSNFPAEFDENGMAWGTASSNDPPQSMFCNRVPRHTLWWTFNLPKKSRVLVTTAGSTGNIKDTVIGNYRYSSNGWEMISCNDDAAGSLLARDTFIADANSTYYTMIGHYSELDQGPKGNLNTVFHVAPVPDNDTQATAQAFNPTTPNGYATVSGAHGATETSSDPSFSCRSGGAGKGYQTLWWKYQPTSYGRISLNHVSATGGYGDSLLAVYDATPGTSSEIACNDNASSSVTRAAINNLHLTQGKQYWIQLASKTEIPVSQTSDIALEMTFARDPSLTHTLAPVTVQTGLNGTNSFNVSFRNQSQNTTLHWQLKAVTSSASCTATGTVPWLVPSVSSGNLPYSASLTNVPVNIDANGLATGAHSAKLCLTSNDPLQPSVDIPVTLQVREVGISPATLGDMDTGTPVNISFNFSGTNTTPPYQLSLDSGTLPPGTSIDANALVGTPTTPGTYTFTLKATDSTPASQGGPFTGTRTYNVTTYGADAHFGAIAPVHTGLDGSRDLTVWVSNTGNKPLELTHYTDGPVCNMDDAGWLQATFPSAPIPAEGFDTFHLSFNALGLSAGEHSAPLCITTNDPGLPMHVYIIKLNVRALEIVPETLPPAVTDASYSFALDVDDDSGLVPPLEYNALGSLPDGLSLSANGELSGIAGAPGSSSFTVTVTDNTPAADGGPYTGERTYHFDILNIDVFADGFETPLMGRLQLDHYGKAVLPLSTDDVITGLGDNDSGHLFDLMVGERRIGAVEASCTNAHCSVRVHQRSPQGGRLVGEWIPMTDKAMVLQILVGHDASAM